VAHTHLEEGHHPRQAEAPRLLAVGACHNRGLEQAGAHIAMGLDMKRQFAAAREAATAATAALLVEGGDIRWAGPRGNR
jgi:hypothetical protein